VHVERSKTKRVLIAFAFQNNFGSSGKQAITILLQGAHQKVRWYLAR